MYPILIILTYKNLQNCFYVIAISRYKLHLDISTEIELICFRLNFFKIYSTRVGLHLVVIPFPCSLRELLYCFISWRKIFNLRVSGIINPSFGLSYNFKGSVIPLCEAKEIVYK